MSVLWIQKHDFWVVIRDRNSSKCLETIFLEDFFRWPEFADDGSVWAAILQHTHASGSGGSAKIPLRGHHRSF
jgi:hypothetical protein